MLGFAELFHDLDGMTKTGDRIERMSTYFSNAEEKDAGWACLLYTSPSPRDLSTSRMPSSA